MTPSKTPSGSAGIDTPLLRARRRASSPPRPVSSEQIELALEAARVGTWRWDMRSGIVEWDETLERTFGIEPGMFGGTYDAYVALLHPDDREATIDAIRRSVETASEHRVVHRIILQDGAIRWIEGWGRVTRDATGTVTGMIGVATDITERKNTEDDRARALAAEQQARREEEAARERLAFLSNAGVLFSESLDPAATLRKIARLAVPRLADWCSVHLLSVEGSLNLVAIAQSDPSRTEWLRQVQKRWPPDTDAHVGAANVIKTGKPELYPTISEDLLRLVARNDEQYEILRSLGLRSAMIVPLIARGRALGALTFVSERDGAPYDERDLEFATALAQRAALGIDNALLVSEATTVAKTLQQTLLPPKLPEIPGVALAAAFHPGTAGLDIGGDFYDVFQVADQDWAFVIGDVCGTGVEAATITALARYTLRAGAITARKPSSVLKLLNGSLHRHGVDGRFVTAAYIRIHRTHKAIRMSVCSAGHPLPLLLNGNRRPVSLGSPGTILGVWPDVELTDRNLILNPGDAVVMYTDGLIEARNKSRELFGEERLSEVLRGISSASPSEIIAGLEQEALAFAEGGLSDDVAMLALRITE